MTPNAHDEETPERAEFPVFEQADRGPSWVAIFGVETNDPNSRRTPSNACEEHDDRSPHLPPDPVQTDVGRLVSHDPGISSWKEKGELTSHGAIGAMVAAQER